MVSQATGAGGVRGPTHDVGEQEDGEEGVAPADAVGGEAARELAQDLEAGKERGPAERGVERMGSLQRLDR